MQFLSTLRLLTEVAGPLMSAQPPKKHVEKAVDGAAGPKPMEGSPAPPAVVVSEVASVGTLLRLVAEPPMILEQGGWRCAEPTRVAVTFGGGQQREFDYAEGTLIPVAAGMIHFPEG